MATAAPKRTRNAAATREAILDSARKAFARSGYDGAGVREIAAGAGVTAMLVNRYFGSKEQLFAEVTARTMSETILMTPEILNAPSPGKAFAAGLVAMTRPGGVLPDGFQIMLKSAASERAAEIGRVQIEKHHQKKLTEALGGDLAAQRAAVVFALVAGFQVMRQMIGLKALAKSDPADLLKVMTPLLQSLMDGEQV